MASPVSVLVRNRDIRCLLVAQMVMFGGDWFVLIPLLTILPDLTGGGFFGGLVLAVDTGAVALVLPYAGTIADRFDRRRIMLVANLTSVVAVLTLFLVRTASTAWIALVAVGIMAMAKAFYTPAASAAVPNLVDPEDLAATNAVSGSMWGTMLVVGSSLGGLMAQWVGPYPCFGIAAGCLALAAGLLLLVRRSTQAPQRAARAAARPFAEVAEAVRHIVQRPNLLSLVTVKLAVSLGNGVLAAFPLIASVVFGLGPAGTGLLFAARGLGAVIGPVLLRRVLTRPGWLLPGLAVSMAGYGLAYIAVGLAPWFALALPLVALAHVAGGGNWAMSNYALQVVVPDGLRGRVFATDVMLASLAVSLSQLGVGALVDQVSIRLLVVASGALTLAYAVGWRLVTRHVMRYRSDITLL
ncbi:MAG: MFS transporter [Dactylosporangium sp.]|nr:MFS transporter [Dactylosporangium sp.]NNJ60795.1 MFS transporter [Dactylosporangium sp.]